MPHGKGKLAEGDVVYVGGWKNGARDRDGVVLELDEMMQVFYDNNVLKRSNVVRDEQEQIALREQYESEIRMNEKERKEKEEEREGVKPRRPDYLKGFYRK